MLRIALLVVSVSMWACLAAAETTALSDSTRSHYLLSCGGCHGYEGISNSKLVPTLKGLAGFYLNTTEGRNYLPRLPNVAFSAMSDQELAAVLNYVVFDMGEGSAPAGAKPYVASEVGRLRRTPLTEVALHPYRREIVDTLISRFHASDGLRVYSVDLY